MNSRKRFREANKLIRTAVSSIVQRVVDSEALMYHIILASMVGVTLEIRGTKSEWYVVHPCDKKAEVLTSRGHRLASISTDVSTAIETPDCDCPPIFTIPSLKYRHPRQTSSLRLSAYNTHPD